MMEQREKKSQYGSSVFGMVNRFVGVDRGYQLGCHGAQGRLNNLEEKRGEF